MGFLDSLLKKETRKIISGVVDSVVDSVTDNIRNTQRSGSSAGTNTVISSAGTNTVSSSADADEEDCSYKDAVLRARVEKVFSEEWSGYEVRRDIPATEMGAPEGSRAYSYGLYLQGQPKAMVMLLGDGSDYKRKAVVLSHKACEQKGVFCMNLLEHMPNRRLYISQRLKDNVK